MSDFTTLTVVVRGEAPTGDLDHDAIMALLGQDEIMFVAVEDGITSHALTQGADPSMWAEGEWAIQSTSERDDDDRPLYWHNTDGWVSFEHAQRWFTTGDMPPEHLTLPDSGTWVDATHPDES